MAIQTSVSQLTWPFHLGVHVTNLAYVADFWPINPTHVTKTETKIPKPKPNLTSSSSLHPHSLTAPPPHHCCPAATAGRRSAAADAGTLPSPSLPKKKQIWAGRLQHQSYLLNSDHIQHREGRSGSTSRGLRSSGRGSGGATASKGVNHLQSADTSSSSTLTQLAVLDGARITVLLAFTVRARLILHFFFKLGFVVG
ncbi:hypothetical protein LINPERHAP1_LOCUS37769 [Linum perenne]